MGDPSSQPEGQSQSRQEEPSVKRAGLRRLVVLLGFLIGGIVSGLLGLPLVAAVVNF